MTVDRAERGFIFAATGERYVLQARRAARNLRLHHPDAEIDLYTDTPPGDDVFSREYALQDGFFRPKIEALRRSRFDRTVYLDSDTVVLTQIDELFDALDDMVFLGVLGVNRNRRFVPVASPISPAFPTVNSGVLAVKRNNHTQAFLRRWEMRVRKNRHSVDQVVLRHLLFGGQIGFRPLGAEYNLKDLKQIDLWGEKHGAPKILHCSSLHDDPPKDPLLPVQLDEVLSPDQERRLGALQDLEAIRAQHGTEADARRNAARKVLAELSAPAPASHFERRRRGAYRSAPTRSGVDPEVFKPIVAALSGALLARPTLRVCCVGEGTGVRPNLAVSVLRSGFLRNAHLTVFQPLQPRRTRLTKAYAASPDLVTSDALIGAVDTTQLFTLSASTLQGIEDNPRTTERRLRRAQSIATPVPRLAQRLARALFPQVVDPADLLQSRSHPSVRLIPTLEALGRSTQMDVLFIGSTGTGPRALDACDIDILRPAVIVRDVTALTPIQRKRGERRLMREYRLVRLNDHLLAIRRSDQDADGAGV